MHQVRLDKIEKRIFNEKAFLGLTYFIGNSIVDRNGLFETL